MMGFMIGFGSTETEFEDNEFAAIKAFAAAEYRRMKCDLVEQRLVKSVEKFVADRAKALRAKSVEYKTAENYPTRYSDYYPTVLSDASNIVCLLRFSHYNRRHALSPDGWAMMSTEACRSVLYSLDIRA